MSEYLKEINPEEPVKELHIAPSWTRFLNYFLDYMVLGLIMSFFVSPAAESKEVNPTDLKSVMDEVQKMFEDPKILLLNMAITLGYYIVMESLTGQTIGKIITRTEVVDEYGHRPTFLRILGRTLCRMIPFEAFSFLFTPIGWHDSISKTLVIKKNFRFQEPKQ